MPNLPVKLKIINSLLGTTIPLPEYATAGAAGMDLRACLTAPLIVAAGETVLIPTGIAIYIQDLQMAAMILPRSGLGHNYGIVLGNLIGLIDADYQGELKISCWNRSTESYTIAIGERIAQLVFVPILKTSFDIVAHFDITARGEGGFGHTGGG